MLKAGDSFKNPRNGARMEIREWTPERVIFDRLYKPQTGRSDPHVHFDITQSWEVLSGKARVVVEGEDRDLAAGEKLNIELGQPHQDVHNPSDGDTEVRWLVEPNGRFVESFADAFSHMFSRGELNDQDEFPTLALLVVLHATKAKSYAVDIPRPLQKLILPLGALAGRLRGYKPFYGEWPASASTPTR